MKKRSFALFYFAIVVGMSPANSAENPAPTVTTYGEINLQAPEELAFFSFLVGKWAGQGKTRLEDGSFADFEMTWIGRYILDGTAIADEFHSVAPGGSPYLGISLRHYNSYQESWVIEYLNVSNSFLRKQVNPQFGSVTKNGNTVVVIAESDGTLIRENYAVLGEDSFTYIMDTSNDNGESWDTGQIEIALTRSD